MCNHKWMCSIILNCFISLCIRQIGSNEIAVDILVRPIGSIFSSQQAQKIVWTINNNVCAACANGKSTSVVSSNAHIPVVPGSNDEATADVNSLLVNGVMIDFTGGVEAEVDDGDSAKTCKTTKDYFTRLDYTKNTVSAEEMS